MPSSHSFCRTTSHPTSSRCCRYCTFRASLLYIILLATLFTSRSPTSPFAFLLAYKSAAKPPPRSALVKKMVSDAEVARFIAELFPTAVKCMTFSFLPLADFLHPSTPVGSYSHRTLLAFSAATMHDYISTVSKLDDGMLAFVLPALLTPLQAPHKDANIAVSPISSESFANLTASADQYSSVAMSSSACFRKKYTCNLLLSLPSSVRWPHRPTKARERAACRRRSSSRLRWRFVRLRMKYPSSPLV